MTRINKRAKLSYANEMAKRMIAGDEEKIIKKVEAFEKEYLKAIVSPSEREYLDKAPKNFFTKYSSVKVHVHDRWGESRFQSTETVEIQLGDLMVMPAFAGRNPSLDSLKDLGVITGKQFNSLRKKFGEIVSMTQESKDKKSETRSKIMGMMNTVNTIKQMRANYPDLTDEFLKITKLDSPYSSRLPAVIYTDLASDLKKLTLKVA